jgi:hypothetical protein
MYRLGEILGKRNFEPTMFTDSDELLSKLDGGSDDMMYAYLHDRLLQYFAKLTPSLRCSKMQQSQYSNPRNRCPECQDFVLFPHAQNPLAAHEFDFNQYLSLGDRIRN